MNDIEKKRHELGNKDYKKEINKILAEKKLNNINNSNSTTIQRKNAYQVALEKAETEYQGIKKEIDEIIESKNEDNPSKISKENSKMLIYLPG